MSEPSSAPTWATDAVQVELQRAFPEGLDKAELADRTGMGPSDLRNAIAFLEEAGQIKSHEDGWIVSEEGHPAEETDTGGSALLLGQDPDAAAQGDPGGDPEELVGEDDDVAAEEAMEEGQAAAAELDLPGLQPSGTTRYEARVAITIGYYCEPHDDETEDDAARREAAEMRDALTGVILDNFPDLAVSAVLQLSAYDRPRRVL